MNQKTSKVEKEFYLRCSYLTLSVLFDKEPKKIATLKSQIENLTFEGRFKIASLRITSRIASFFCLIFH